MLPYWKMNFMRIDVISFLIERQRNCAEITEPASQESQERLTLPLQAHHATEIVS